MKLDIKNKGSVHKLQHGHLYYGTKFGDVFVCIWKTAEDPMLQSLTTGCLHREFNLPTLVDITDKATLSVDL